MRLRYPVVLGSLVGECLVLYYMTLNPFMPVAPRITVFGYIFVIKVF